MTTHFRLGSNCECIDRHADLLVFCPVFFAVFYFFVTPFSFLHYC